MANRTDIKFVAGLLFSEFFVACSGDSNSQDIPTTNNSGAKTIIHDMIPTNNVIWKSHAYLELVMKNDTANNIDETSVSFFNPPCTYGIVGAWANKGYLGWTHPIGTNALVCWRDFAKVNRSVSVNISTIYDPKIDGCLTFSISETNAVATFKKIVR